MGHWTTADMPDQRGRLAVVTGTGGLGFETALALARAGAAVVVAGRNPDKGLTACETIRRTVRDATVRFEAVDLASLDSVADFATRLAISQERVDLLVNNAGVMVPPVRQTTSDGFELQFGVNYLGHFALTGRLTPLLVKGRSPRVVTLSSVAARGGAINFDDLNATRSYRPMPVYAQSKLACLMFALELQRRSEANGWGLASLASHPGVSRTDLLLNAPGPMSLERIMRTAAPFLFQPAAQGALPTLYAGSDPGARGGAYYGPDRLGETRGHPALARIPVQAVDTVAASRLWALSESLSGVRFPTWF